MTVGTTAWKWHWCPLKTLEQHRELSSPVPWEGAPQDLGVQGQVLPDRDSQAWKEVKKEVGRGREVTGTLHTREAHSLTA